MHEQKKFCLLFPYSFFLFLLLSELCYKSYDLHLRQCVKCFFTAQLKGLVQNSAGTGDEAPRSVTIWGDVGSKSLSSCSPAFSSSSEDMRSLLWGVDQTMPEKQSSFYSLVLGVSETIERATDAPREQCTSGEAFCLRKPEILKTTYGDGLESRTMFQYVVNTLLQIMFISGTDSTHKIQTKIGWMNSLCESY